MYAYQSERSTPRGRRDRTLLLFPSLSTAERRPSHNAENWKPRADRRVLVWTRRLQVQGSQAERVPGEVPSFRIHNF